MSWIDRFLEERLSQAANNGELDVPHLHGKPIADLDKPRQQGWWADQFVQRERSHDRRQVAEAAARTARAGFWRAPDEAAVRQLVGDANAAIVQANLNLVDADRLDPFDTDDIVARWRELHRRSDG